MRKTDSLPTVWEQQPHTKAKHDILTRYLGAWFGIFGSSSRHRRVNVLDGFAGPGVYATNEPGSPILALRTLLDHRAFPGYSGTQFNFIFNELNPERFTSLRQALADFEAERSPWPRNVDVKPCNMNFQQLAQQMMDAIGPGKQLAPTFAFIDPFGYRDVPMSTIRELVSHPACELFIYFDFNSVNRFATAGNVDDHFSALFGCDDFRDSPTSGPSRNQFIHDLYARQLRKECGFAHIASFRMITRDGHTSSYLYFCTRNDQAYDKMKQAMWALAPSGDYGFDDRYADQPMLFGNEANTSPLQNQLAEQFHDQTVSIEQVTNYVIRETPFHSGQVKTKTLRPMQKADRISSPNQKIAGQFPPGTLIRFDN
ncbi:three-Cys-motif partner protein TcmP [Gordonia sp. VNK1]|uniref:three-Cys-motif partner protein TcmP n=1 Tax=Gordonia oleivorans TaxID=3156618 RepID=UPI0032B60E68